VTPLRLVVKPARSTKLTNPTRQARSTKPLTNPLRPAPRRNAAGGRRSARATRPQAVEDPGAPKLLLSMDEAAYALSCGKSKVYALIEAGEIVSFKVGGLRRVPVASLESYVARRVAQASGRAGAQRVQQVTETTE
jgi:excisionase family DNA binding protein